MTDPQIALMMLGLFIVFVFLGFPIAFTLMAMGIGFGYYAYFDARRMWRSVVRAVRRPALEQTGCTQQIAATPGYWRLPTVRRLLAG